MDKLANVPTQCNDDELFTDHPTYEADTSPTALRAIKRAIILPALAASLRASGYTTDLTRWDDTCLYRLDVGPVGYVRLTYSGERHRGEAGPLAWHWLLEHPGAQLLTFLCMTWELVPVANWVPKWIVACDRGVWRPRFPVRMSGDSLPFVSTAAAGRLPVIPFGPVAELDPAE